MEIIKYSQTVYINWDSSTDQLIYLMGTNGYKERRNIWDHYLNSRTNNFQLGKDWKNIDLLFYVFLGELSEFYCCKWFVSGLAKFSIESWRLFKVRHNNLGYIALKMIFSLSELSPRAFKQALSIITALTIDPFNIQ